MSSVPCTSKSCNGLAWQRTRPTKYSYWERGRPVLVVLGNQVLALSNICIKRVDLTLTNFLTLLSMSSIERRDELWRMSGSFSLSFTTSGSCERCYEEFGWVTPTSGDDADERTLASTPAGKFWFGRIERTRLPTQRAIPSGGLVRRMQGLVAITPESCETLS